MKLIEHAMPSHEVNYLNQLELVVGALHLDEKSSLVDDFFWYCRPLYQQCAQKVSSSRSIFL